MPLLDSSHKRISIQFFLIAMVFILFDVEIAFLYPWALVFRVRRAWPLFVEMFAFLAVLAVGYAYIWKKGPSTGDATPDTGSRRRESPGRFPPEAMARIERILERYPTKQAALLPVLWVAQETWGWISREAAEEVARILELPPVARRRRPDVLHDVQPAPGRDGTCCSSARRSPATSRGPGELIDALPEASGDRPRGDHGGRQVHDGRGRVHRRLRPRAVDDGQRQVPRADGREEAGRPARPALGGEPEWNASCSRASAGRTRGRSTATSPTAATRRCGRSSSAGRGRRSR